MRLRLALLEIFIEFSVISTINSQNIKIYGCVARTLTWFWLLIVVGAALSWSNLFWSDSSLFSAKICNFSLCFCGSSNIYYFFMSSAVLIVCLLFFNKFMNSSRIDMLSWISYNFKKVSRFRRQFNSSSPELKVWNLLIIGVKISRQITFLTFYFRFGSAYSGFYAIETISFK